MAAGGGVLLHEGWIRRCSSALNGVLTSVRPGRVAGHGEGTGAMALGSDRKTGRRTRLLVFWRDLSEEVGGHEAALAGLPQFAGVEAVLVHLAIDVDEIAATEIATNSTTALRRCCPGQEPSGSCRTGFVVAFTF